MSNLWGVTLHDIARIWPLVESMVAEACSRSQLHSPNGVRDDLFDGKTQLWIAWDGDVSDKIIRACLITKLEKSAIAQWCRAILVAGVQPKDWFHHIETVERWAKASNASRWIPVDGQHRS